MPVLRGDRCVVVVDNASEDGSGEEIRSFIRRNGYTWARVVESPVNGGFAAGNNVGIRSVDAEYYLLLNNDTLMRAGAIDRLLEVMESSYPHPNPLPRGEGEKGVGLLGPRLENLDGTPQISTFRNRTPLTELLRAARTGPIDRVFEHKAVAIPLDSSEPPEWISFACVLIRREVFEQIGLLDEGYFMYFEDIDFCRRARRAGWHIAREPAARVVHLRGGSSSVKAAVKERMRPPRYFYESRSRYFSAWHGGRAGVIAANLMWVAGRGIAWLRETSGRKQPHTCDREWRDIWTTSRDRKGVKTPSRNCDRKGATHSVTGSRSCRSLTVAARSEINHETAA